MALPNEPWTRVEQYLNRIATESGTIPDEALTRVEQYLEFIAENGDSSLPSVTTEDNGKFLRVVSGAWSAQAVPSAESNSFGGGS